MKILNKSNIVYFISGAGLLIGFLVLYYGFEITCVPDAENCYDFELALAGLLIMLGSIALGIYKKLRL